MKLKTSIRNLAFPLALAALAPASLNAATTFTIGFDSSAEGFSGVNGTSGTFAVSASGGFLTATAGSSGDPRLIKQQAAPIVTKLSTETWSTLAFRVRETDETSAVVTPFDQGGILAGLNSANSGAGVSVFSGAAFVSAVDSGSGFFTVTYNISTFASDDIRYIRFDPIGGTDAAGNLMEVDFLQINAVPEPSAALLGALGALCLLRRRR